MKKIDKTIKIFGLNVFSKRKSELLSELSSHLSRSRTTSYIYTPNPEQVVLASQSDTFRQALQSADWLIPDGVGLVLASWLLAWKNQGKVIAERIPGNELVKDLLELADRQSWQVLVVGGRDYHHKSWHGHQLTAVSDSLGRSKGFAWWWLSGYERVALPTPAEEQRVGQTLKRLKPDLVLVAYGAPYQELWIETHRQLLEQSGVKLAMAVGGSVDFLVGITQRAPRWMRKIGLEWLHRLIKQPWRWRRQLRLVQFLGLTFRELFR